MFINFIPDIFCRFGFATNKAFHKDEQKKRRLVLVCALILANHSISDPWGCEILE
jgi:hypothetical protein